MDLYEFGIYLAGTILPFALGAVTVMIAPLLTTVFNRREKRDTIRLEQTRDHTAAVVAAGRLLLHELSRAQRDGIRDRSEAVSEQHSNIRVGCALLTLVGSSAVQKAARLVRHHAYSAATLATTGVDPRESTYPRDSAYERLEWALDWLLEGTRAQLGVSGRLERDEEFVEWTKASKPEAKKAHSRDSESA